MGTRRHDETHAEWRERDRKEKRARYDADPEFREREKGRRRALSPEKLAERRVQERARYARKAADPEWRRRRNLTERAAKYGLTVEALEALYAGGCGICGAPDAGTGRSLHVDHDHECCDGPSSCGECVRGVLCYRHNITFEMYLDSPQVIRYLERTPAGRATLTRSSVA